VLVDELAHTNVPGVRHSKRYEDVEEILDAGIDVVTTSTCSTSSQSKTSPSASPHTVRETLPDQVPTMLTRSSSLTSP